MRIAVISANIGGFDTEKCIPKQTVEFDRYYYTDKNLPVPMHTQDARMKAKFRSGFKAFAKQAVNECKGYYTDAEYVSGKTFEEFLNDQK